MRDEEQKAEELYIKIGELIHEYSGAEIANALAKGLGMTLGHQDINMRDILMERVTKTILDYDKMFRDRFPEFKLE